RAPLPGWRGGGGGRAGPPRGEPAPAGGGGGARGAIPGPQVVRLAVDRDLPLVEADAAQLERAFANLLENAVRHGGGRPVLVKSRLVDGKITLRVVDQGPGIPQSEWRRIFQPVPPGEGNSAPAG